MVANSAPLLYSAVVACTFSADVVVSHRHAVVHTYRAIADTCRLHHTADSQCRLHVVAAVDMQRILDGPPDLYSDVAEYRRLLSAVAGKNKLRCAVVDPQMVLADACRLRAVAPDTFGLHAVAVDTRKLGAVAADIGLRAVAVDTRRLGVDSCGLHVVADNPHRLRAVAALHRRSAVAALHRRFAVAVVDLCRIHAGRVVQTAVVPPGGQRKDSRGAEQQNKKHSEQLQKANSFNGVAAYNKIR